MDKALRAIIVDDEELARGFLKEMLGLHERYRDRGGVPQRLRSGQSHHRNPPDLLFLDVQMPKLDGFEVLELIDPGPAVIFVTAYDQYAMRAFDAHAVDYLLKPFTRRALRKGPGTRPPAPGRAASASPTSPRRRALPKIGRSALWLRTARGST